MIPDYDHLPTPDLNDLIYELSCKSKLDHISKNGAYGDPEGFWQRFESKMALRPPVSLSEAIPAPKE